MLGSLSNWLKAVGTALNMVTLYLGMASSKSFHRHPALQDDAGDPGEQGQQHVVAEADDEGQRRRAEEDVGRAALRRR